LPNTAVFDFKPGQFVTLDLPIAEQRNKRWRSYSIASAPDGTNVIELIVSYMHGGKGSAYLFDEIRVGSVLDLRGPQGIFLLPPDLQKDLYLICTGTGIAPFRSMLQYIYKHNLPHSHIYLIYGSRTVGDLLYADEMRKLEQQMPGFEYLPTLSREDWSGRKGYVHAVYEELLSAQRPANFMLCGWRDMIDEAKKRLTDLGIDKKSIHIEIYG
jgi:CDP-4-dehydro-6-deoxyglucose reductase